MLRGFQSGVGWRFWKRLRAFLEIGRFAGGCCWCGVGGVNGGADGGGDEGHFGLFIRTLVVHWLLPIGRITTIE